MELVDGAYLPQANLQEMDLSGASLRGLEAESGDLRKTTLTDAFVKDARLADAYCAGAEWQRAYLGGADLSEVTLRNASLQQAYLGKANLTAALLNRTNLMGSDLQGVILTDSSASNVTFSRAYLRRTDLTRADCTGAVFRDAILERAILDRTELFEADLTQTALDRAVISDVRIDERTVFNIKLDGGVYCNPPADHEFYDRIAPSNRAARLDKAKGAYRVLERLGRDSARPDLQSGGYLGRKEMQRQLHATAARAATSIRERVLYTARWAFASVSNSVLRYGESPYRVVGWSFATILFFAGVYAFGLMAPPGDSPTTLDELIASPSEVLNLVYYSTLTFMGLGYGDFQPVGFDGRAVATVESTIGAILLALLIFVLGRRTAR